MKGTILETSLKTIDHSQRAGSGQTVLLILFWLYAGIPLAWGVYSTLKKAMALFA